MKQTTLLVIEDDPDHVALIEAVFHTGLPQWRVEVALSGEEARSYLLGSSAPLLIVLDLRLPDSTGFEILEWLSSESALSDIPVIVFTSSTDPNDMEKAYSLGAKRYVVKPLDFSELVAVVKEVLACWLDGVAPEGGHLVPLERGVHALADDLRWKPVASIVARSRFHQRILREPASS